jgi:hypothetical protein
LAVIVNEMVLAVGYLGLVESVLKVAGLVYIGILGLAPWSL